jgi:hypothetical protein
MNGADDAGDPERSFAERPIWNIPFHVCVKQLPCWSNEQTSQSNASGATITLLLRALSASSV